MFWFHHHTSGHMIHHILKVKVTHHLTMHQEDEDPPPCNTGAIVRPEQTTVTKCVSAPCANAYGCHQVALQAACERCGT